MTDHPAKDTSPRVERWAIRGTSSGYVGDTFWQRHEAEIAQTRVGPSELVRLVELRPGEEIVSSEYLDALEATAANATAPNADHSALLAEAKAARRDCDHPRYSCEEVGCDYHLIRRLAAALALTASTTATQDAARWRAEETAEGKR
jgi:hypothetical protein